jgi:uncharacterized membrane protein YedE/YeeE
MERTSRYSDPYWGGVALGLVLLAAFVLLGQGIGASGGFSVAAAETAKAVAPGVAQGAWFERATGPGTSWLVVLLAGIALGGFLSARLAGRARFEVERGATASLRSRLAIAFGGGAVMGLGAVLARGCTSGQALTGGALLSVGGWVFLGCAFAAAYLVTPLVRRGWR